MKHVWSQFQKNSSATNLALVALVAVLFMALPEWVYNPLNEAAVTVFRTPFVTLRDEIDGLVSVREDNRQLREALMQVTVERNRLLQQRDENIRLREQLGYEPPEQRRLIPLEPVSVRYRGTPVAIEVNKGEAQGVQVGQSVISGRGLVGRVDQVTARTALVQLLTDPECRVAGRVSSSREQGIVRFYPSRGLALANVPIDGQVKQGDLVISSGLGGSFPEGLPVGVVKSVMRNEREIFADVILQPVVNFNAIDELYALAPPLEIGPPLPAEQPPFTTRVEGSE
ncbi:MAG TPA: rod shape-determining protein MreC [candidate division Zixibacteria bacterium]|nr:rod shape-determining protein MreC [candidate division Zixibacteria bacterium]